MSYISFFFFTGQPSILFYLNFFVKVNKYNFKFHISNQIDTISISEWFSEPGCVRADRLGNINKKANNISFTDPKKEKRKRKRRRRGWGEKTSYCPNKL